MNTKIIKFDINKNLYDTLIAKQGDTKSRFLLFNLLDGSIPFSLENRSVRVYAIKPDKTEVFNDLIITDAAKGYCILELTTQMLAVAGTVRLELMVIEEDKKLTSNIFYMDVKESINSEKAVVSTNEFGALLTALQDVDNWNKEFTEKSGKLEELYTPRLNELGEQLDTIESNVELNYAKKDDVAKISSGTPLFAPSTTEMTDTTKNYVNTTDGYLYIYSEGNWTKTNVQFQSTGIADKSISKEKLDAKLSEDIRNSSLTMEILNSNLTNITGLNSNGAVVNTKDKTILINGTGTNSNLKLYFKYNFNNFINTKIRIYFEIETTNNYSDISLGLNVLKNGVVATNVGGIIQKEVSGNKIMISREYWIEDNVTEIQPYLLVTGTSGVENVTLKLIKSYFNIQAVREGSNKETFNKMILDKEIDEINSFKELKVLENQSSNSETLIDVSSYKALKLEISNIYDSVIFITNNSNEILEVIDLNSFEKLQKVFTNGLYFINVEGLNLIKIRSVSSYKSGSRVTVNIKLFKNLPSIINYNSKNRIGFYGYNKKAWDNIPNLVEYKDGKVYCAYANTIRKYSQANSNSYEIVATISNITAISRFFILENGNMIVISSSGDIFTKNGDEDFKPIMTITKPHDNFGTFIYKNKVILTEYSTSKPFNGKVYLSEDYGVTFNVILEITSLNISYSNYHSHNCTYDPYDDIYWVCIGDGINCKNYIYSTDKGITWNTVDSFGSGALQATSIIPLRDCVLFVSDARTVGVTRISRPIGGIKKDSNLKVETAFYLRDSWGKTTNSEVPIGITPVIDYKNNLAYFGYVLLSTANTESTTTLKYGELFCTNGYDFKCIYKHDTTVSNGVASIFGDIENKKIMVKYSGATDYHNYIEFEIF